jgi:integrase/recombinase XerD
MSNDVARPRVVVREDQFVVFGTTFDADANRFLDALRARNLSPRTERAYAFDLISLSRWLTTTTLTIEDVRAPNLIDFIALQQQRSAAPRSINRRLTTVRLFVRFLTGREVDQGIGILLPAPHYRGPGRDHALGLHRLSRRSRKVRVKEARRLVEPLTPTQVRSFLRSVRRYRDLAIVHLMLLCGLRSREVLELATSDVVWADQRLRIQGKGERERALPLPDSIVRALRGYLQFERPRSKVAKLFLVLQGPRRGQPMTTAGLRNLFRHRRRQPTLAIANPHRFRHTFGADMARAGVRLPILQRMMGHADLSTTLQYIELSLADVADEFNRANAAIETRYRRRVSKS